MTKEERGRGVHRAERGTPKRRCTPDRVARRLGVEVSCAERGELATSGIHEADTVVCTTEIVDESERSPNVNGPVGVEEGCSLSAKRDLVNLAWNRWE